MGGASSGRAIRANAASRRCELAREREQALDVRLRRPACGAAPRLEGVTRAGRARRRRGRRDARARRASLAARRGDAAQTSSTAWATRPFALRDVDRRRRLPGGAMIPMSALNRARRALVDAPARASATAPHATTTASARGPAGRRGAPRIARRRPRASSSSAAPRSRPTRRWTRGPTASSSTSSSSPARAPRCASLRARPAAPHVTLAPPRIRKPGEEKIDRYLRELEPDALLVR